MSDWSMLIWLTQLGLSVVLPLGGMTGLAIWLCGKYQLGRNGFCFEQGGGGGNYAPAAAAGYWRYCVGGFH